MTSWQAQTFVTIRQEIQRRLRSTDTGTGTADLITAINRAVNNAIHEITASSWFEWSVREFWLATTPPVASASTQAMWITAGQTMATFSGAGAITNVMVGRILLISGGKVPYEITTVTPVASPLTLYIAGGYEGEVNVAAAPFRVVQNSFNMSSLKATDGTGGERIRAIRRIMVESAGLRRTLTFIPARTWENTYPEVTNENEPEYYTVIRWTGDGEARIRVWPVPDTRYAVRMTAYCWLPELSADADVVEMPGAAHRVVEDLAYARLLAETIHAEVPMIAAADARARAGLERLRADNIVKPDWDMSRAESPFSGIGLPVAVYPPEFGQAVQVG